MELSVAYDQCEAITRREARNFAYGIKLLRAPERRAMSAIYALARRIDDVGDGDAPPEHKLVALEAIEHSLEDLAGTTDPVLVALGDAAARYRLPMACFAELIDGCRDDVVGTAYDDVEDLVAYCRKVAGTVGRLSLAVFMERPDAEATRLADDLGVALQLVNILRDVVEDRDRGRVYLPARDAAKVGCDPALTGPPGDVARLVALECERAEEWFDRGLELLGLLDRRSRACVAAMAGIYRRLLDRIERDPLAVTKGRLGLPAWEKALVAARSLAGARP